MAIYPEQVESVIKRYNRDRIFDRFAGDHPFTTEDIVSNAPALLYVYDLKEHCSLFQNRPLAEILGYDEQQGSGSNESAWSAFMHPEDQRQFPEHIERMKQLKPGETATFEYRMRHADGDWRWVLSRDTRMETGDENRYIVGTATDITQQKRVEQRITEQARLLDLSNDAIIIRDLDGRVRYSNKGVEQLYGWTKEEMQGQNLHQLLQTKAEGLKKANAELMKNGAWTGELDQVTKDGRAITTLCRKVLDRDPDGNPIAVLESNNDITERKQILNELDRRVRERTADLQAANKEMEAFTYSIAHDLRAPLRAIVASSKILVEELGENLADEHKYSLERQAYNASRLAMLIDELLKYSRLAKQELNRTTCDITQLAHEVAADLSAENPTCSRFLIQDGLCAKADRCLVKLLLMNLMENACKFSPDLSPITVGSDGDRVFFVRDQGVGFEMTYAHKIFLLFERLVTDEQFPGTGIGLASAQRIVNRHGGAIGVESCPGKGTTFYFTLEPGTPINPLTSG